MGMNRKLSGGRGIMKASRKGGYKKNFSTVGTAKANPSRGVKNV
jgi:hypothetical protein